MKKKVAVITHSTEVGKFYCSQLKGLFGEFIELESFSLEDNNVGKRINADLFVVATHAIYDTVKKYIVPDSDVVITNITLSKAGLEKIMKISAGTKAMLVNLSVEMALETISLIYYLGVNHIELVPVYPGIKQIPELKVAITPGELRHVPKNVEKIIDVGHRILDSNTIVEIALKLNLGQLLQKECFIEYFKNTVTNSYSLEVLTSKTNRLENQFEILLKVLEEGIIEIGLQGYILACNKSAEDIIGIKTDKMMGANVREILPLLPFEEVRKTKKPIKSKLIQLNNVHISVDITPVISYNKFLGAFAILNRFNDTEFQQHKLRAQLLKKGHRAKYYFEDIIGNSPIIVKAKEIAKKMAESEASILITGESGVGKELFAQAIHNSSIRSKFPFVAINCAAISENLLESELFGYEEGAFTGAKKGGKIGLFEFAHRGTLFLDEIGEMSLNLQAKLLRVIQEREVMRIGGDRVIKIDVRIIAATNRNLKELVNQKKFRKDFYYRLNVLPLQIPPLRDRGKDILLLAEEIKKELHSDFTLDDEVKNIFLNHNWEGNVRELRNYIEYLTYLGDKKIKKENLPFIEQDINNINNDKEELKFAQELEDFAGNSISEYIFVMEELALGYKERKGKGRRSIAKAAQQKDIYLTEQEIRSILVKLEEIGLATTSRGRGGSKMTQQGLQVLKILKG